MEALIRLAADDSEIQRIAAAAMESGAVHGVVLDIDPFWLSWWNYSKRLGEDGFSRMLRQWSHYDFHYPWSFAEFVAELRENYFPYLPLHKSDLKQYPSHWDAYANIQGFDPQLSPVRITLCLRPEVSELSRIESRQYRVLYETRPIAMLSGGSKSFRRPLLGGLSAGDSGRMSGTMGGILRDQKNPNRRYGMTCAHVMTAGAVYQPARIDNRRAAKIGKISAHTPLQLPAGICNAVSTVGINTVDVALVEIDSSIDSELEILDIGPLTGITPISQIGIGQAVEFTGRSSGNRMLKIGGLNVIKQVQANGKLYCFKNLIQLNWPKFWQLCATRPVTRGDSGAWICNPSSNGFGWCGMIIADDRLHGYAVFAETIREWWEKLGLALAVS